MNYRKLSNVLHKQKIPPALPKGRLYRGTTLLGDSFPHSFVNGHPSVATEIKIRSQRKLPEVIHKFHMYRFAPTTGSL